MEPVIPSVTPGSSTTVISNTTVASVWIDTWNRAEVIAAYKKEFGTPLPAIDWKGDINGCDPGVCSTNYLEALTKRIRFFRALAGINGLVVPVDSLSISAQVAAKLMLNNKDVSHYPPKTWGCYSTQGAYIAARSNLAILMGASNPDFTTNFMYDAGNNNTSVGHRYSLLSTSLSHIGIGTVYNSSSRLASNVMYTYTSYSIKDTILSTRAPYISWPYSGYIPYHLVFPRWSYQSTTQDLSASILKINNQIVTPIFKDWYRIVWELPVPEKPTPDQTYEVTVSDVKVNNESKSFTYKVVVIDTDK